MKQNKNTIPILEKRLDHTKERIKETMILFLYACSATKLHVNINTFKRYVFLYYQSTVFLGINETEDEKIQFNIVKSNIVIPYFEEILEELVLENFVKLEKNEVYVQERLIDWLDCLICNENNSKKGYLYSKYEQIKSFVQMLNTYDDELIYTIFFSEPTFSEAIERRLGSFNASQSKLSELLIQFKEKIKNDKIDNFDVLTYWTEFVLNNYYKGEEEEINDVNE